MPPQKKELHLKSTIHERDIAIYNNWPNFRVLCNLDRYQSLPFHKTQKIRLLWLQPTGCLWQNAQTKRKHMQLPQK